MALFVLAQSEATWIDKAYLYMEQDSLEQAELYFKQAIEANPTSQQNFILLSNLALVQHRRGLLHKAIENYTLALYRSPLTIPILMGRAKAYLALGNDNKAYADLCNVLDKDENHIEALYYRAFIYINRHEYGAARIDYKHLLTQQPNHENALLGIALLDQREGRLQTAELQLTMLVECYPNNPAYLQARADVLMDQQMFDLALLDLETAISLQPIDGYLYAARAELYLRMGRCAAAKNDLDRAVALGVPRISLVESYKQCE